MMQCKSINGMIVMTLIADVSEGLHEPEAVLNDIAIGVHIFSLHVHCQVHHGCDV